MEGKSGVEQVYVTLEEDGSDAWRADEAVRILADGGMGVLPTETGYSFVTKVSSKKGVERILMIKGAEDSKKPLSLLCIDHATIDRYTLGIDKARFKLLKRALPGPYTMILPASEELPKQYFKDGKKKWKRKEIGVRMPSCEISQSVLSQLDEPLLCSSVPTSASGVHLICEDVRGDGAWCKSVDFIVDAGERPVEGSTIFDLTDGVELVRSGMGSADILD